MTWTPFRTQPVPPIALVDLLHTTLVIAFVGVTTLLLALTVLNRLRVRQVVMSWRSPRPARLPAWPILFIGVVVVLYVYAVNATPEVPVLVFGGYAIGGVLWLLSSLLTGSVYITELGIVHDVARSSDSVAWVQVVDWFEAREGRREVFVFIYEGNDGHHRRLELPVPTAQATAFRFFLRERLEDRVDEIPVHRSVGRQALEG